MAQQEASPKVQHNLEQANRSIRRYAELLEQLLLLSEADGSLTEKMPEIDINHVLEKVMEDLAAIYPEAREKIQIDWQSLTSIPLPEFALYTILKNLIENALLHACASQIKIAMQDSMLIIQDNGDRLNQEDIQYLGQRFWRKSAQQKGHGLGLSLLKMILHKYHYAMQFEMRSPSGLKVNLMPKK